MLPLMQQEPVWKESASYRLGAQYRSNESRLLYMKGLGWFIRIRDEFNTVSGLTASHGLAGPFHTQEQAFAYLRHSIQQEQSQTRQ